MNHLILALAAVLIATSALADGISLSTNGKNVTLTSTNGTSEEIFSVISKAYKFGFKNDQGEDYFEEFAKKEGSLSLRKYTNKNLFTSRTSAFALVYKVEINTQKKGELKVDQSARTLFISGEAARLLLGAMKTAEINDGRNRPVGVSRASTDSGKVVCSRTVRPGAVTTCLIQF